MAEYISRDDVLKKAKSSISVPADNEWDCGYNTAMAEMQEFIKQLPSADVQSVRCGEWEIIFPQNGKPKLKCTNCHSLFDIRTNDKHTCIYPKFCEECGADMRGDKND